MARDDDDRNEPTGKELRLMLKAAREEGREEVQSLLTRFGMKSVRDLESVLDEMDKQKREKDRVAAATTDKSKSKDEEAEAKAEAIRAERELRETLLDAGVKKADLDLAVTVMGHKTARMSKADLAKYDADAFAKDFKASNPQSFRDYDPDKSYRERREAEVKAENDRVAAEKKAADDVKAKDTNTETKTETTETKSAEKATTGLASTTTTKTSEKATFNALKATPDDVKKRLAEIKIMAAKPPVFTEGQ
jgi:hypothetical protein